MILEQGINQVIHGKCEDVLKALPDKSVDLILTDIPYGINYKSGCQTYDNHGPESVKTTTPEYFAQIQGDEELPTEWLSEAYRILKDGSAAYIFCHWTKWHILHAVTISVGFNVKNMIVCNKSNHGMGDLKGSFAPKHELLMMAVKGRHLLNFPEGRKTDVWEVPVKFSGAKRFHPNEKPLSWLIPCIENSSQPGDLVLDPFAGSSSTAMACRKLGRNYMMIESDIQFVEISNTRLGAGN